LTQKTRR